MSNFTKCNYALFKESLKQNYIYSCISNHMGIGSGTLISNQGSFTFYNNRIGNSNFMPFVYWIEQCIENSHLSVRYKGDFSH